MLKVGTYQNNPRADKNSLFNPAGLQIQSSMSFKSWALALAEDM
jgi:hypothetical protein